MKKLFRVALPLIGLASASAAYAASVTFDFEGYVRFVDGVVGVPRQLPFSSGDPISGFYTFEPVAGREVSPGHWTYEYVITDVAFTVGSYTATFAGGFNEIGVYNINTFTEGDRYTVNAYMGGPTLNGLTPADFALGLLDNTGTAWETTTLPLLAPDIAAFPTWQNVSLMFRPATGPYAENVWGQLTKLTTHEPASVPEPGTVALLALGVLGIAFVTWRTLPSGKSREKNIQ